MRIVSISYNYSPEFTSAESWLQRTALYNGVFEALAEKNEIISIKQISLRGEIIHNGVRHIFTGFGTNRFVFIHRLNRLIKSLQPDVVLLQGLHHPLAFIHLKSLLNPKTKIIAQHHAERPSLRLTRYAQMMADKFIDAYLFASREIGQKWVNVGIIKQADKINEVMEVSTLFHPVEKEKALEKTNIIGHPIFLWVGRLNENKDPITVVSSFLQFVKEQPSAKLYMIYQTDELLPEMQKLLASHPLKESVILVGKIINEDLLYWYNSADFLLSGSYYEGSGTALCEAMSCRCIPVVTDIPSFRMITKYGYCGILYEAGNQEALIKALQKTQSLDLNKTRQKCMDWFEQKLSFNAIARDIETVAKSIVK